MLNALKSVEMSRQYRHGDHISTYGMTEKEYSRLSTVKRFFFIINLSILKINFYILFLGEILTLVHTHTLNSVFLPRICR